MNKDIKQYQDDIKAGVDVSGEQDGLLLTTRVKIGMLRQWLNEDRKCEPMVTNDDIIYWLELNKQDDLL